MQNGYERDFLVLYASETGNSIDVAERIVREARRRLFCPRLASVDAYPVEDLISELVVVFVVSTTGTGVEPRPMTSLWTNLLRSDLADDLFEDLKFAIFGLGDSSYEKFCWAAKKLDRRLEGLGADRLVPRGEGDDQHRLGLDGSLEPWMSSLFSSLSQLMPSQNSQILPDNLLQSPRVSIRAYGTTVTRPSANFFSSVQLHSATVRKNDRITDPTWFQDVRHIELDLKSPVDFSPGDISVIYPRAEESAVNSFLQVIGWEDVSEQIIQIGVSEDNPWPSSNPLPLSASLRDLLSKHLDFNAVPRRSFFELIRHFASDETEAEKLEEFSSPEGQEELYDYCQKVRRTIQEVLAEFKSVSVPVKYIFDLLPPLRPRQFSIANSVKLHPKQVHLCIAVVTYRTRLRRQRKGICSNYLASLSPGDTLDFSIIPGSLKLPSNPETPIVCIGPGTGVAPMRAVLQHRIQEGAPNNILYFGCRSAHMDQHYHTEWEGHHRDGCLEYRVACSRDGPPGTRRTYVQDLITHDNTRLGNILTNSMAYVYISGSSNQMPRDVKQALQSAVASVRDGGLGKETDIIRELEAEGRLFEECWS